MFQKACYFSDLGETFIHRMAKQLLLLLFLLSLLQSSCSAAARNYSAAEGLESSPLTTVRALIGQSVLLPCDVTPATTAKPPILVLFYYGESGTPIYTLDARDHEVVNGRRWADENRLGRRAQFIVSGDERGLLLTDLQRDDEGEYRCRVDFRAAPTKNFRILLDIIMPPRHLLITSSWDEGRVVEGNIGPYPQGADLTLTCQVTGGDPLPSVVWWQAGRLVDRSAELQTEQVTRNTLRLPPLDRDDVLTSLTCTASNNNISAPLSASVTIDVALPPTSVRIWLKTQDRNPYQSPEFDRARAQISSQRLLVVKDGVEYAVACEALGSRPQAFVLWEKDGHAIDMHQSASTTQSSVLHAGPNSNRDAGSLSTLTFIPSPEDHQKVLRCTAYSPKIPDEAVSDHVTLEVHYAPKLNLTYAAGTPQDALEVGDSFGLSCGVDANPPPTALHWAKDGVPLESSSLEGVTVLGWRVAVQGASRRLSGAYTCAAANSLGAATSHPLTLNIKFAPECADHQKTHYGAGLKEVLEVTCKVWSHPAPLSFRWAFNSTMGLIDIPQNTFSNNGTVSRALYIPHTSLDFGSLLCWAANDVGMMLQPCVYHVVPAVKPEAVENCRVHNNSSMPRTVALVTCSPGYDGGMNQTFSLEVREFKNLHSRPLAQVSHSPIPVFHLKNLKIGEPLMFIITAVNARGTSAPVTITYTAPHLALSRRAPNAYDSTRTAWVPWTLLIAIVFGGLITALVCFCVALFMLKFRTPRKSKSAAKIVYAGPIRPCEKEHLNGAHTTQTTCDHADCEEKQLLQVDFTPISPKPSLHRTQNHRDGGTSFHIVQPRLDVLPQGERDNFSNQANDVRLPTPTAWGQQECCGESCSHGYTRSNLTSPSPASPQNPQPPRPSPHNLPTPPPTLRQFTADELIQQNVSVFVPLMNAPVKHSDV